MQSMHTLNFIHICTILWDSAPALPPQVLVYAPRFILQVEDSEYSESVGLSDHQRIILGRETV